MKARIISAIVMLAIAIPLLIVGGIPFKIFVAIVDVNLNLHSHIFKSKRLKIINIGKVKLIDNERCSKCRKRLLLSAL